MGIAIVPWHRAPAALGFVDTCATGRGVLGPQRQRPARDDIICPDIYLDSVQAAARSDNVKAP